MRIAQIAPPWIAIHSQGYRDTENAIYQLTEELVALGHDVTLFAPDDAQTSARKIAVIPRSLIAEGVPWQASLKAYYYLHKSLNYAASQDFDIVHTHLSYSGDMYLFPLSSSLTIPHVTTLHNYFPFDTGPERWVGDADLHFMEWAPNMSFVVTSESARSHISFPINVVNVVHHGVHTQQYWEWDISPEPYFVWFGYFTRARGAHLAIEAAKSAGVPLILAGIKDVESREAMYYYHHMIEPHIDGKQIRSIGPVNMRQKAELLQHARGLLNIIDCGETSSLTLIEAMAAGCPVIASARGAAPEIISQGVSGFLTNSIEDVICAIRQIDDINREIVHSYAEHYFSVRLMARKYLRTYEQVIEAQYGRRNTEPLSIPHPSMSSHQLQTGSTQHADEALEEQARPYDTVTA